MESCDIEEGYYKTRAYPQGPWVPIRVWLEDGERCPETNELLSDQVYRAEENRSDNPLLWQPLNPFETRNIYWKKISKEDFEWLIILKTL